MKISSFQIQVSIWMLKCFGPRVAVDKVERNFRFLEESLELVQACGCSKEDAHKLVEYVFGRPVGEPSQGVGGVSVTLAALCQAHEIWWETAAVAESERISDPEIMEKIRLKQASKLNSGPLPGTYGAQVVVPSEDEALIMEAHDFGQFSKDMLNKHGLIESVRLALCRVLDLRHSRLYNPPNPVVKDHHNGL